MGEAEKMHVIGLKFSVACPLRLNLLDWTTRQLQRQRQHIMAKDESKKEKKARRKSEAVGNESAMSVDVPEPAVAAVETPSKKDKKEKKAKKEKDEVDDDADEVSPEAISPIARKCYDKHKST